MHGLYFVYFYNAYCYIFPMFSNIYVGMAELRKQSANFKQTQRKQIIYFHVNRYIIWIFQRFVKQNKVLRFLHMKTFHPSTKNVNIKHWKNIAIRIIKINKGLHESILFVYAVFV
jgi:hypothetical protein